MLNPSTKLFYVEVAEPDMHDPSGDFERLQEALRAQWDFDNVSADLVVLQNFDYAPYFSYNAEELLGNLARYVEDGGALVMTGGDRSFDLGDYQGTPLERVLPVQQLLATCQFRLPSVPAR